MDITISTSFKKKTTQAVFSILLFILVYLLLLVLAAGLTALFVYLGLMIIVAKPMFFTLIAGAGLASIGVLIFIFLVKFIFKKHVIDLSNYEEITREEQPKLFAFIDGIVTEVGTRFPKKIYVSHEVNASVFYDSSFWSMFLPIKKNLHIGMGLVNTISEDELKAILSHEFGHFSQKSMKIGSYVYNVNQVIFNMLYDNSSYNSMVQSWASVSSYFVYFANIAIRIVEVIQWILQKMYAVVNKSYMQLSREMEFHADAVASTVTGYLPLKNSLLRMDLANKSYNEVLSYYDTKIEEAVVSANIFEEQYFVLQFLAIKEQLPIENGLPYVSQENGRYKKSKVVIDNQWASHPEVEDRIAALEKLNILKPTISAASANNLFVNLPKLQEKLTRMLFQNVTYDKEKSSCTLSDFKINFEKNYNKYSFNEMYKGYYDTKNPMSFNVNEVDSKHPLLTMEELFGVDKVEMVFEQIALGQDTVTLENIQSGAIRINTFDYEGVKYKSSEADVALNKIKEEVTVINEAILQNDKNIFLYFHQMAVKKGLGIEFKQYYTDFFDYDALYDSNFMIYQNLMNGLHFTHQSTPFDTIKANFKNIIGDEQALKNAIVVMMGNPIFADDIKDSRKENFQKYLSKDWSYFDGDSYYDQSLNVLYTAINDFQYLNHRGYFLLKKRLLDFQMELF